MIAAAPSRPPAPSPRLLRPEELVHFAEYLDAYFDGSGKGGAPRFDLKPTRRCSDIASLDELFRQWTRPLHVPGWSRAFALFDGGPEAILGHVTLQGGAVPERMHRAVLGLGVARRAQRRGLGAALLAHAIEWARGQRLDWIDLHVFRENAPAIALYRKFGFEEVCVYRDLYRVDGHSIDDVLMALPLG